ncbi:hypothetical protein JTE90_022258 [Oedothorax gibbosus]|uniref:Uncharacterized protein n=1 Tax=Oedothorax gibbosus TaxID=931172 RepID=A0AAV6VYK0_9ARAC|nr:hypothetical protein JTE90_022258 [Oedothorax gibbosus]
MLLRYEESLFLFKMLECSFMVFGLTLNIDPPPPPLKKKAKAHFYFFSKFKLEARMVNKGLKCQFLAGSGRKAMPPQLVDFAAARFKKFL